MDDQAKNVDQEGEDLLTIDEACKFLDTSKSTLYRVLGQGDLKGTKVGKQWRFRKADLTPSLQRGPEAVSVDASARAELDAFLKGRYPSDLAAGASDEDKAGHLIQGILNDAVDAHASDIHFEAQQDGIRIRYRIDGVLADVVTIPRSVQELVTVRLKTLC